MRDQMDSFLSVSNFCFIDNISIGLNKANHLVQGLEQPLAFLVGFRQYMQYHLHGMKTQLHSSMRKKVDDFATVIKQARRDKEGQKNWAETFGGQTEEDKKIAD
jgi:hypothetical protein